MNHNPQTCTNSVPCQDCHIIERLEYLREQIRKECISYDELDQPANHIFTDIQTLKDYTEKAKATDRLIDRYELVSRYINNQTDEEWGRLLTAITHRHKETEPELKDTPTMA